MISRFFARWFVLWVFVLLMYQISDVTPQLRNTSRILRNQSKTLTIIPINITASRRDYPSVIENRGKWFIITSYLNRQNWWHMSGFTARHVISDTWYNYFIDHTIPLIMLHNQGNDTAHITLSGVTHTWWILQYNTWLSQTQVLMAQYRINQWDWLTGTIMSSGNKWIIIDLPVAPGDSGSPVIFADQTLWIVSQSYSWNQAIIQKIINW